MAVAYLQEFLQSMLQVCLSKSCAYLKNGVSTKKVSSNGSSEPHCKLNIVA